MAIRVVVLSSVRRGTASFCLPLLAADPHIEIAQVVFSRGALLHKWQHRRKKLAKLLRIGPLGALNGIRMRRWYGADVADRLGCEDLSEVARRLRVPYAETPGTNFPETVSLFQAARADLGLSLGNGFISRRVFSAPAHGMINLHGELLPEYRNAQSVIWAIYEGSRTTGFTIHEVNDEIDAGRILLRQQLPISFRPTLRETVVETCAQVTREAAAALVRVVADHDGHGRRATVQTGGRSFTTPTARQFLRMWLQHRRLR